MKYRRTNKIGEFEVKKVKNKGAVSKNVVRVAIKAEKEKSQILQPVTEPV